MLLSSNSVVLYLGHTLASLDVKSPYAESEPKQAKRAPIQGRHVCGGEVRLVTTGGGSSINIISMMITGFSLSKKGTTTTEREKPQRNPMQLDQN